MEGDFLGSDGFLITRLTSFVLQECTQQWIKDGKGIMAHKFCDFVLSSVDDANIVTVASMRALNFDLMQRI
jgi:hypothetical protein